MQERKINLASFILENMDVRDVVLWEDLEPELKKLLLNFGKQLLELASENAELNISHGAESGYLSVNDMFVDEQSILDTIKQVEI